MKRLINDPYDVVEEMLAGYVTAHKDHVVLDQTSEAQGRVVVSKSAKQKARELEDALLFANAAVRSNPEETGEYLEGELAALALSAQRLRADADELRIAATPFMPKPRKRCRVSA